MWRRSSVLFGVGVMIAGVFGKANVEAETVVSETSIELALEDDRTKSFLQENRELLHAISGEYKEVKVILEGDGELPYVLTKEENLYGIYPQFLDFFSKITELNCVIEESKENLEDYYTCIQNQEVDLVMGITLPEEIVASEEMQSELQEYDIQLRKMDGKLFNNPLSLAVPTGKNYTKAELSYVYWGTTMEYETAIADTVLSGHTILYNSYAELRNAFRQDEIQGMLLPMSKLEYAIQVKTEDIQISSSFHLDANEYYIDLSTSQTISEVIDRVTDLYVELYDEYFQNDIDGMIKESSQDETKLFLISKYVLIIGGGILFIYFMVILIINQWNQRQFKNMLTKVRKDNTKWEDILFVNLGTKKIQSQYGFSFYGLSGRTRKKKISLKDMTKKIGFDFTKYYEYIMLKHETEFVHEFELYIQGIQYHYVENGIIKGKKVVSRIYRKEM